MSAPLPPLSDLLATARVVSIPTRTRFRNITHREALLFAGPEGWAEFSPFIEYSDAEAAAWLAAAVLFATTPTPRHARATIPVNATVPAVAAGSVAGILNRFPGCTTVKVKVGERGQSLSDDVARVAAVRDALGPGGRIRVDANGAWSPAEAFAALSALDRFVLEYAEQPCASIPELQRLRGSLREAGIGVNIAADESVRRASDPLRVARLGAADVLVLKAAPLGGVDALVRIAARSGLPCVVSSALETSVGISRGVHAAAALPDPLRAAGLGTAALLAGDVVVDPLLPVNGTLPVVRVVPNEGMLCRFAAEADRRSWWLARLSRCYEIVAARGSLAGGEAGVGVQAFEKHVHDREVENDG